MAQVSIIINVSEEEHMHSNGLSGNWIVPARKNKEIFGILVVRPTLEIQDIGDQRRVNHVLKARPIARDIIGIGSDSGAHALGVKGTKEKWGLYLCEAEPDISKELEKALEDEIEYLNLNPPDVKYRRDPVSKANVAVNIEDQEIKDQKEELSYNVQKLWKAFEHECRRLVQKSEIDAAKKNLFIEDMRLVTEGDNMWAREKERQNINETHMRACKRLGQDRPWCYVPQQLVDCPGCGAKIKENILTCPNCSGWLDAGIEELRNLSPRDRAEKMYPERYSEPVQAGGKAKS